MMEIARLYRVDNGSSLKAFADIIFNGQVLVKGVKVFKDKDGNESIAMPSQQAKNGKWYETVRLLDDELKQELQETVLDAFNA